jgi:hypothetical protein
MLLTSCSSDLVHVELMRRSVAEKVTYVYMNPQLKGGGTGFHVKAKSGQTVLMTNNHICEGAKDGVLYVKNDSSPRAIPRKVLEMSAEGDACLVEPLPGIEGLELSSNDLVEGNHYHVFGHPKLYPLTHSQGEYIVETVIELLDSLMLSEEDVCAGPRKRVVTIDSLFGEVKACVQSEPAKQMALQIYPGNSGSPVLNDAGEVVGIMFASERGTIFSFAVPLPILKALLEMY